jgi:outer membrane lipoprotein-sorting protein
MRDDRPMSKRVLSTLAAGLFAAPLLGALLTAPAGVAAQAATDDDLGAPSFMTAPMEEEGAITRLSPDQVATITRLEAYLNQIDTVKSRFVQISTRGNFAEGDLFLSRPGRIRFEYDPPHPVLLVADGHSFLYYDKEMKNATFIPMEDSPLWFLIQDRVSLTDEIDIVSIVEKDATIALTLRGESMEDVGEVTLVFSDEPIALRKWVMTDAEGTTVQVALIEPEFSVPIDKEVFSYADLDVYGLRNSPNQK